MTIFCKKSFAFPNPNYNSARDKDKDKEILCPAQQFTCDLPEDLKNNGYFMGAVKREDIIIIDKPENADKALKSGTNPKRNEQAHEEPAEKLGILDGGDAAK